MEAAAITFEQIEEIIRTGNRIDREQARWLWLSASDSEIRNLAMQVRSRFHEKNACSYMIMRIINYTNVCSSNAGGKAKPTCCSISFPLAFSGSL